MKKSIFLTFIFIILLCFCTVVALCVGKYSVRPVEGLMVVFGKTEGISAMTVSVIKGLRLPRVLASIVVGAALSVSGAVYQAVFRNPLVSPDYLGVTGGASIGAATAILLGIGSVYISLFAFAGGVAAMVLAMLIPVLLRNNANIMLVLSGVIVGAAMSSVLGFIKYLADPNSQLASIIYWTMGSFGYVTFSDFLFILPVVIPPLVLLFLMSYRIDLLSMGENEAKTLGVNVVAVRTVALVSATLLTAASVCVAGTIGWVGLIIPHLGRLLTGPSARRLIPLSAVMGGLFMLIVDTATRTVSATEMPVSILTGALGIPFYCWLLYRQRKTLV